MSKNKNPTQYTINLKENFNEFVSQFWEEFKHQETKPNKSSERRMRALLRKFNSMVVKPYRTQSLEDKEVHLDDILDRG